MWAQCHDYTPSVLRAVNPLLKVGSGMCSDGYLETEGFRGLTEMCDMSNFILVFIA